MDTGIEPSKSMKELAARRIKCWNFEKLNDGEQKMVVLPAFDMRHIDGEDRKYGQHCNELIFAERRGNKIVSATFFTGWTVDGSRMMMNGHDELFMCTGLYTHWLNKQDAPEAYDNHNCPFTGGDCWGDMGSSLYGETILDRLVHEGSAGVWDEIDKELKNE